MPLAETVKKTTLAAALALPTSLKRRLAGRPVERDGLTLDVDTQLMLRLQKVAREQPAEDFPIVEGRTRLAMQARMVAGKQPIGQIFEQTLAGVPVRVHVPRSLLAVDERPTLVFFHGGGFIYGGGHGTHDAPARFVAERAGVQVISVDYRLAPEAPFPAAYDDALTAFREVISRGTSLKVDLGRVAVGGDSAGGNLAAGVALAAAREGLPLAFQLLVYPMTDTAAWSRSRELFADGFFLTRKFIELATESYLPDPDDRLDPRASPHLAELSELSAHLAPAHVVTAGFDPLRDEGEEYAEKLTAAGVRTTHLRESGMIHGFFNMVGVGESGPLAVGRIATRLHDALS